MIIYLKTDWLVYYDYVYCNCNILMNCISTYFGSSSTLINNSLYAWVNVLTTFIVYKKYNIDLLEQLPETGAFLYIFGVHKILTRSTLEPYLKY